LLSFGPFPRQIITGFLLLSYLRKIMYFIHTPKIIRRLFSPELVWEIPNRENKVFLTFDDGPIPEVTPEVLQILNKYNVKATFFCVGDNVRKHPEICKMILDQGHQVGNHSFAHLNGSKTKDPVYIESVAKASHWIDSGLFRPPYGRIKRSQVEKLKRDYKIIMWTVLAGDFDVKYSPEDCLKNVLKYARSGSIIVFHDSLKAKSKVLFALPKVIEALLKQGLKFDVIS
jgi:peptidoglycan-N-acetylglucosamine deacetylase